MNKLCSTMLLAVLLLAAGAVSDALAQYRVCNHGNGPVILRVEGNCGGTPWQTPYVMVAPGACVVIPTPPIPPCVVTGVRRDTGAFYAVGYCGPLAPPNPPFVICVNPTNANID